MHAQLRIADNVLFQPIADEAVILNVNAERYYGLDDVATRAWQLLMEYGETEAVIRQMMAEYEVDEATLRQDITALVASMEQRGLIKRVAAQ
jgi:DNA-binding MarR family transcriptional regulator